MGKEQPSSHSLMLLRAAAEKEVSGILVLREENWLWPEMLSQSPPSPPSHPLAPFLLLLLLPRLEITTLVSLPHMSCPLSLGHHSAHFSLELSVATITVTVKGSVDPAPTDRDHVPPFAQHPAHAWPRRELDKQVLSEQRLGGSSSSFGCQNGCPGGCVGFGRRLRRTETSWASPSRRQLWGKAEGQKKPDGISHKAAFTGSPQLANM